MNLQRGRKAYILICEGEILDVWSNIKYLCRDMKEDTDNKFPSYSKISKMDKSSGKLTFTGWDKKEYVVLIKVVR